MLTCARIRGIRAEHATELLDDLVGVELGDGRARELVLALLLDAEVPFGECGDLRQVRDADDLASCAERAQTLADRACRVPADARVDLVEDERARAAVRGDGHQR